MDKPTPIFGDGIMFTRPTENAPAWVKGKVSVNVEKFIEFLKAQALAGNVSEKGWLNLDLKEGKTKTLYFQVNTWKPEKYQSSITPEENAILDRASTKVVQDITPSDIPF